MKHSVYLSFLFILIFDSCTSDQNVRAKAESVDMVYSQLDTENSRWFFFSSACRPFGMVNLRPNRFEKTPLLAWVDDGLVHWSARQ